MSMFEQATKSAILELVEKHGEATKFGTLLTRDAQEDLIEDFYNLLVNSRKLKAAGDRIMGQVTGSRKASL